MIKSSLLYTEPKPISTKMHISTKMRISTKVRISTKMRKRRNNANFTHSSIKGVMATFLHYYAFYKGVITPFIFFPLRILVLIGFR